MSMLVGDQGRSVAVLFIAVEYVWHLPSCLLKEPVKPPKKAFLSGASWFAVLSAPPRPGSFPSNKKELFKSLVGSYSCL